MNIHAVVKAVLTVGSGLYLDGPSLDGSYSCVFEEADETAYFYALDLTQSPDQPIVDAVHIYNVDTVSDSDVPSELLIGWSADDQNCALIINGYVHAVFDFTNKRGYARSNFPPPAGEWSRQGHEWSEAALEAFK